MGSFGGQDSGGDARQKPQYLSRLRDRPHIPAELVGMSDDEYAELMRKESYSERFIEKELLKLQGFREDRPLEVPPVTEGPKITPQYAAWAKRRREQAGRNQNAK